MCRSINLYANYQKKISNLLDCDRCRIRMAEAIDLYIFLLTIMAKKKPQQEKPEETTVTETNNSPREVLQLFVGVDFAPEGKTDETRIEAGIIELGVLPIAFQTMLIEKKKARIITR